MVRDEYIVDRLMAVSRDKRISDDRQHIVPRLKTLQNWQTSLRVYVNKRQLFAFLGDKIIESCTSLDVDFATAMDENVLSVHDRFNNTDALHP